MLFRFGILCIVLAVLSGQAFAQTKPNVLLVIADDCTYTDMEVYGGQAKTPNINRLASEGMKFTRCYQAAPMCSPTRHCLYTGIYPVKSGAYPNHTRAYGWVKSIASYLKEEGYSAYLSGKTHIGPKEVFPFEYSSLPKQKNPDPQVFKKAVDEASEGGKPFLFVAASNEPHSPWNRGDASKYPAAEIELPPVLVDCEETRDLFSHYLAEISYFDSQVGQLLEILDSSTQRDNTVVIVLSEQGNSFPFAKWTCYDVGVHSGCVVRWPNKVRASSTSDALVEYVDVVPTLLEIAGLSRPDVLDGRSFLSVLLGETSEHKQLAFGLQTSRGINNGPEAFGIRYVTDGDYIFVSNLNHDAKFVNATTASSMFRKWDELAKAGDKHAQALVSGYHHRPAEEYFSLREDPWNRHNLIRDEQHAERIMHLRSELSSWMAEQGDKGVETEMAALERMPGRKRKK